ncbi:uncharacterized protein [Argopecten irradians]|uniref:uncharacterized protein n=1 Tax=Argopecten irradians TaxID=31199 RepID=UPI00371C054F
MATANVPIRVKSQTTCLHHKGKQLEFYCEECQELACSKCVSSIHKRHSLCDISEIADQRKGNIRNFIDRTEECELLQIRNYIASTDVLLNDNDKTFEKLSTQVKMQTEKLKRELDNRTAVTLSLYQKMKKDNDELIGKYKQDLETYEKQLVQQMQQCKTTLQQGSDIEIYDTICEIDSQIHLPAKPTLGTASFSPNMNPRSHIELAFRNAIFEPHGRPPVDQERSDTCTASDNQEGSSTRHLSTESEEEVPSGTELLTETKELGMWEFPYRIRSLCPTINDQAWISNYSKTLTLMGRNGTIIQDITHKVGINDISLSPTTHRLWACDNENNILELESGQLSKRFKTKDLPRSICVTTDNHIIIGMTNHITKYTTQGQMVLTSKTVGCKKPLVCSPYRIAECPITNNVAVIDTNLQDEGGDGNKHVVIMDTDFQELFICKGEAPTKPMSPFTVSHSFSPIGVVYDSQGNLIIADSLNFKLLLLSGAGVVPKLLHMEPECIYAVGIDREGVLWSGCSGPMVTFLQYNSKTHTC